jgi:signal transduction histidine kinase
MAGRKLTYEQLERRLAKLERQLRQTSQSDRDYRQLFSSLKELVNVYQLVRDRRGRIVDWILRDANPESLRNLGKTMAEVAGKRATDLFDAKVMAPFIEVSGEVAVSGKAHQREVYFPGTQRHFLTTCIPFGVDFLVTASVDITAHKQTEEALRKAHDELEQRVQERTAELVQTSRMFRMVSACNETVVRATDEADLMTEICKIAVDIGGYRMAWVGFADDDAERNVRPVAATGFEAGYLGQAKISWADNERGRGPTGTAIRTGRPQIGRDFLTDPKLAPWRMLAISRGFRSSVALPLAHGERVFGALNIYAAEPEAFDESRVRVLAEMAGDLAFGIMALRTRKALRESHDRLRALASDLTLAEQRERKRLAHVLHDHIQQLLVGAKIRLAILGRMETPELQRAAKDVDELLTEAIDASRSLTAELSPPILHEAGLAAALDWLARWMKDQHGLVVSVSADAQANPSQEDVSVLLFQSVRELLFNVVKHVQVKTARVEMGRRYDRLEVVVSDEGVGFDPSQVHHEKRSSASFGLFSIRERLGLLGGSMKIESTVGRGSRFTLAAPLQQAGIRHAS